MARVKPRFTASNRTDQFKKNPRRGGQASTRTVDENPFFAKNAADLRNTNSKHLTYPHFGNTNIEGGHCVVFRINKTNRNVGALKKFVGTLQKSDKLKNFRNLQPGEVSKKGETLKAEEVFSKRGRDFSTQLIDAAERPDIGGGPGGGDNVNIRQIGKRLAQAIILYMPPQVQTTYTLNYSDVDLGFMSQAMVCVFDAMGGQTAKETANSVTATQLQAYAKGAGLGALNMAAPGARAALQIRQGAIISNKMELSFTGVTRREFQFVFNFTPKSEEEANVIHDIVKTFKYYSHPEFIPGMKGNSMTIPDSFDIEYKSNGNTNQYLHKISTCFCHSINVQYGGDRYTAHTDISGRGSPPTNTILTLGFKEMELITKKAIAAGY